MDDETDRLMASAKAWFGGGYDPKRWKMQAEVMAVYFEALDWRTGKLQHDRLPPEFRP